MMMMEAAFARQMDVCLNPSLSPMSEAPNMNGRSFFLREKGGAGGGRPTQFFVSFSCLFFFSVAPLNVDLVSTETLCASALGKRSAKTSLESEEPGMRDHDAVVDAEALVGGVDGAAALGGHAAHHGLQALVAPDAADDEDLRRAHVRHGALRDLHEHRVYRLLEAVAEVFGGDPLLALL